MELRGSVLTALRVGHGYDVHRLVDGRTLILGGVTIPMKRCWGIQMRMCCPCGYGCASGRRGYGDIGTYFPDSDVAFLGCSSLTLLERVHAMLAERGWNVVNVDATVVAQRPKIAPYLLQMRRNIAQALDIAVDQVNESDNRGKLGFTGDGSGMAAHAVCLMEQNSLNKRAVCRRSAFDKLHIFLPVHIMGREEIYESLSDRLSICDLCPV